MNHHINLWTKHGQKGTRLKTRTKKDDVLVYSSTPFPFSKCQEVSLVPCCFFLTWSPIFPTYLGGILSLQQDSHTTLAPKSLTCEGYLGSCVQRGFGHN